jgi:hypothetical protein
MAGRHNHNGPTHFPSSKRSRVQGSIDEQKVRIGKGAPTAYFCYLSSQELLWGPGQGILTQQLSNCSFRVSYKPWSQSCLSWSFSSPCFRIFTLTNQVEVGTIVEKRNGVAPTIKENISTANPNRPKQIHHIGSRTSLQTVLPFSIGGQLEGHRQLERLTGQLRVVD